MPDGFVRCSINASYDVFFGRFRCLISCSWLSSLAAPRLSFVAAPNVQLMTFLLAVRAVWQSATALDVSLPGVRGAETFGSCGTVLYGCAEMCVCVCVCVCVP